MRVFQNPLNISNFLKSERSLGKKIGLIPTMGALHQGHLALIKASQRTNDLTVCSIFVNPTQFNNKEDLYKYPRPIESDRQKLEEVGCDVLFAPSEIQMYGELPRLKFDFGDMETVMEGKFRPGHFNGVGIIVAKLFNIIQPNVAYFGQKDYQQFMVISTLVNDLSFQIQLVCHPTIREKDGLALSSRNLRLSPEERSIAPEIYKCLQRAKEGISKGITVEIIKNQVAKELNSKPGFQMEYIEFADAATLSLLEGKISNRKVVICLAAFLGNVRLIDNIINDI